MSSLVATGTFTIIDVNDGMRTASLTMYQWSLNAPTTFPSGSSTYTWASQAFTAPATLNGWSITPPASAVAGHSLWVCFADYTDNLSTATSTITWSTASAYPIGAAGAQGPSVVVNANLPEVFTATDGTLDSGQANIVFTTLVSGVTTPTYVWTFSGFQTAPTNSGTSTQTITAAQFGTSKSATVTCTVNGVYLDTITVVRLEKTTAAANATVGATLNDIYYSALTLNGNATIVVPLVSKVGGAAAYDTQAYSVQSYVGNCACRFKVSQLNAYIVVGLNTDPTTDANYTSIDYGIIFNNIGLVYVSESGTFGSAYTHPVTGATKYSVNDVFEVSYAGTTISYLWNGSVIKTTTVAANLTLFLDSSILTPNSSFTLLTFGQYKAGNVIGQINAGNASSYIANAAIQTAQIADLTVTTGKIANLAVNTLQIAGNAVIVPVTSSIVNGLIQGYTLNNTAGSEWVNVISASIDMTGGTVNSSISVSFSIQHTNFGNIIGSLDNMAIFDDSASSFRVIDELGAIYYPIVTTYGPVSTSTGQVTTAGALGIFIMPTNISKTVRLQCLVFYGYVGQNAHGVTRAYSEKFSAIIQLLGAKSSV